MEASELQLFYTSSEITTEDGAILTRIVTTDSDSNLSFGWLDTTGIDWTYATGWFNMDTTTPELRGQFFFIRSATGTVITVAQPLAGMPVAGDTFKLIQGIRFKSDTAIPTKKINAFIPELTTVSLRDITGVTIKQCFSDIDLYIRYVYAENVLAISSDGVTWNSSLVVTSDVTDGMLQTNTGEWLRVDVNVSRLPVADTEERVMVSDLWGTVLPPVWLDSNNENSVLHHFAILKNSGADTQDVQIQSITEVGTAEIATEYTDGDTTIELTDIDGLPGRDFWLYLNDTSGDLRYVTQRAGNICYLADTSEWQEVAFDAGINEPTIGDSISAGSYGGILRAVYLISGSWAGNDAAGIMIISDSDGGFGDGETLIQDSLSVADVDGDGVIGIRGFTRQTSWSVGESVLWYPPYDVLVLDADSNNEFETIENPQSIISCDGLPNTWVFNTDHYELDTLATFGPDNIVGLVFRRILLTDTVGSLQIEDDLSFDWE